MISGWNNSDFYVPNDVHVGGSLIGSILDGQYQQLKIVAKSGSSYSTITAAQNSITDAASNKIYTVLVFPGEYDEAITLKDYVNIIAIDPFNTYILRQVTDGGNPVHCDLRINIDNRQSDGSHGLYLTAASVIHVEGNITGGSGADGGTGVSNNSTGTVEVFNGVITSPGEGATSYPIVGGNIVLINCRIIGNHADVKAIFANTPRTVKCMNVWSNRDLHANITNLIPGGFNVSSEVSLP